MSEKECRKFLDEFVPSVAAKSRQLNKVHWILETTGASDAADLRAELDLELRLSFQDPKVYKALLKWEKDKTISDPVLKRQINVLIRTFKQNMLPKELLEEIAKKEAALSQLYANFRPKFEKKPLSENEIREVLKEENDPKRRKKVWEASKEIGEVLAPKILELVALRNKAARLLGYKDYFQMQLELQEVDSKWLLKTLADLAKRSDKTYAEVLKGIEKQLSKRFGVSVKELGPWAWGDPFCQEDPLDTQELDQLVDEVNMEKASVGFYQAMGIDVKPILQKSDMWERPGKNQHAFCINIDRGEDVRTLNNVQPSIKWMETILHELGHAIYELGFDGKLPWLLREPPHMITTEAMALIAGRQAYRSGALRKLLPPSAHNDKLLKKADESLKRRQLIFSRWVLVMTEFESELYRNSDRDLNDLWWSLVEKYQMIKRPENRKGKSDWAAKYHIGLAPVYYFSYLLGEMFASAMELQVGSLASSKAGHYFRQKLFQPGNRMSWHELVGHVTGSPLNAEAWLKQFS